MKYKKILVVDDVIYQQTKTKFAGGTTRSARVQAECFARFSHEVFFITANTSDDLSQQNLIHVRSKVEPKVRLDNLVEDTQTASFKSKTLFAEVVALVTENNIELVILNNNFSGKMVSQIKKHVGADVVSILHLNRNTSRIPVEATVYKNHQTLRDSGGLVLGCSEHCVQWWNRIREFDLVEDKTPFEEKWITPIMYSKEFIDALPEVKNAENVAITTTRFDVNKQPNLALDIFKRLDVGYKIFIAPNTSRLDAKKVAKLMLEKENLHIGKPHTEILNALQDAKFYLNTTINECSGIAITEAALYGIPVVVVSQTKEPSHGVQSILKEGGIECDYISVKGIRGDKKIDVAAAKIADIDFSKYDREEIARKARAYWHEDAWYERFSKLVTEHFG